MFDCHMVANKSICSMDGYIGIDARTMTSTEECTTLMHENGHFISGAFYLPYSKYIIKEQAEYKADKAAILKYIPKDEISACTDNGNTELWQLAEHFNVTEDFMLKAILYYKEQELALSN